MQVNFVGLFLWRNHKPQPFLDILILSSFYTILLQRLLIHFSSLSFRRNIHTKCLFRSIRCVTTKWKKNECIMAIACCCFPLCTVLLVQNIFWAFIFFVHFSFQSVLLYTFTNNFTFNYIYSFNALQNCS